jgi:hypothetical protein
MFEEVHSSNDSHIVHSTNEQQPLLRTENIDSQRSSVAGIARLARYRDARLGKDLPAPLVSAPSVEDEEPTSAHGWKICATSISFFVVGMNTSASGVCGSTVQILR